MQLFKNVSNKNRFVDDKRTDYSSYNNVKRTNKKVFKSLMLFILSIIFVLFIFIIFKAHLDHVSFSSEINILIDSLFSKTPKYHVQGID
ncbi:MULTISPECIES: hypothetical protein [Apilactobacillus]|uniref:hypothetical protein n=1 Tax=Apilactobacillus TaxID=2767877 RepID=UPI00112C7C87|nr:MULTISPECIES: hypothetical protein [Apilactobacillus]TPR16744.1 hypothetical protein DYZ95_07120 [Apilactobacillus timberlakei]TPR21507.1 hypothetical protein DY083_05670 [Apilactobacillus timberlakei]TPR50781.1 hypothetical protein DY126_06950 [Apilactobacillus micheneri]